MNATTERRTNMRPENCRVCGTLCEAGQGHLYRDTASRTVRRLGRFGWFVKCDRCHQHNLTNKWQVKNLENPSPTVRRWSVTDVNKWALEVETTEAEWCGQWLGDGIGYERVRGTLVIVHVTVAGERVQLAGGDRVLNRQEGPWYGYEEQGIGGRPFTPAAWEKLTARVYEAIASKTNQA